jgi:hypothetical protein
LVCDGFPVRRPCIEESLRTWDFVYGQRPLVAWGRSPRDWGSAFGMVDASEGVWGGTTERERAKVAHLPASEAIDRLEELRAGRLAERIRGYLNGPRSPRRGLLPSERRVDQMLAERGEVPDRAR